MKIAMLILFSAFGFIKSTAQVFINDAGTREKHFVYEVKQIDEFSERFNNDSNAYIRKVYSTYHVKFKLDRSELIKSLFNYETQSWNKATIDSFVETAINPKKPLRLDFYRDNWFAEANCLFQYQNATIKIPIILRITTNREGGAKWVIAAIKSNSLKPETSLAEIKSGTNKKNFINPESHANNFVQLQKVFADRGNLTDYLDDHFFNRNNSANFYNAVINKKISFITVKNIRYHFMQIDNWIFTVEYFRREALNSGWLINSLKRVSNPDKELYKKKLLEE